MARCIARSDAWWMLMRSISAGSASRDRPGDRARAGCARTAARARQRGRSSNRRRPGCGGRGAARRPPRRRGRPGSRAPLRRTPATCTNPTRRSAFSSVRIAGTRVIEFSKSQKSKNRLSCLCLLSFDRVLHARGLALQIAQVVQLRAADLGRTRHFDLLDRRRVQREDALDALPERDLADGERRARAAAMQADDDAFEHLNALLVAFAHLHVHLDRVARLHRRPFGQLRLLDQLNRAHRSSQVRSALSRQDCILPCTFHPA